MSGLRIAAIVTALVALAILPAAARATVTTSQITDWTSSEAGTPANNPYLISYDNVPTTLSVRGTAAGTGTVDIVCYFGSPGNLQVAVLQSALPVTAGTFSTYDPQPHLRTIAGHACRLRAVPTGSEASSDSSNYAGPQVAVSEAALPAATIPGTNTPYNFYVNDVTFTGWSAWSAAGITPSSSEIGCGGPFMAPIDPDFDVGNFAIDCMGSLLGNDLGAFGGRSEVQVDGRNAYDAGSAQALFSGSENLPGFPQTLAEHVSWDPTTGLITSQSAESWVSCDGPNEENQSSATCPRFVDSGVELERDITTSAGGRVVTMTDKWISTDGNTHAVDLLNDDYVGVFGAATGDRGYEFPGQTSFSEYKPGAVLPGPSSAPGSILVRTNLTAPDGDPSEAVGAITFGSAPSEFRFVNNNEFEEHNALAVPAGGTASRSYIYSVAYSVPDITALARAAEDRFQSPSIAIASPANGATVTSPTVTVSGSAGAGSGIASLVVAGQPVPVAPGGAWTAQVALDPGANTIIATATDGASATAQAQVSVTYARAVPAPAPRPPSRPVKCRVPRLKGIKLATAEKALRAAHCRVGKIKHVRSRAVRSEHVVNSSPGSGHTFSAGHRVELFVSKGH